MRVLSTAVTMLLAAATLGMTASVASAQACQEWWEERNGYYADAGYCFKTRRAIQHFGNQSCRYNNEASVPLTRQQRARIAQLTALERRNGCND
jgi:hypothetical protein